MKILRDTCLKESGADEGKCLSLHSALHVYFVSLHVLLLPLKENCFFIVSASCVCCDHAVFLSMQKNTNISNVNYIKTGVRIKSRTLQQYLHIALKTVDTVHIGKNIYSLGLSSATSEAGKTSGNCEVEKSGWHSLNRRKASSRTVVNVTFFTLIFLILCVISWNLVSSHTFGYS
jgi:hypothetical protein